MTSGISDEGDPTAIGLSTESVPSDADGAEIASLVASMNAFALNSYKALLIDRQNLGFSPYTISMALAMTCAGACEQTERQILDALLLDLDNTRLHPAFNALDLLIQADVHLGANLEEKGFRSSAASWGQSGYFVPAEFFILLAWNYGAPLQALDFMLHPSSSEVAMDNWLRGFTGGMINYGAGSLTERARLSFITAAVLDVDWEQPFPLESTIERTFERLDGTTTEVPMMSQAGFFPYSKREGYEAVELGMADAGLSMFILLPEAGRYGEFEDALDLEMIERILGSLALTKIRLYLPRFSIYSEGGLGGILSAAGVDHATVEERADFCRANPVDDLYVKSTRFKTVISLGEAGARGAASAGVTLEGREQMPKLPTYGYGGLFVGNKSDGVGTGWFSPPEVKTVIDNPFIFLIRESKTGAILFMGRLMNP